MKSCSVLSVKVSDVREAAKAQLVKQEARLKESMYSEADGEIEYMNLQNKSFFRKIFKNFIEVPTREELFAKFMEAQDAYRYSTLTSSVGWITPWRSSGWWERLELLSKLPDGIQDMYLSVEDAKTIRLKEFMKEHNGN